MAEAPLEASSSRLLRMSPARTVLGSYDAVADMTGQTDDASVLMERALVSRDALELALAGFLSAYKGRTFDKQRRVFKHYLDWCLQNDLPPLQARRPHIDLFVRWCESQPWSESYICQDFVGVRSFCKTCVRDDVRLRNPAEFVDAPKVHEDGQARTFLTLWEFAEMCSLRVDSLSQDGGSGGLKFIGKGGQASRHPAPGTRVMRAVRVVVDGRTTGPLLLNQAGKALTTLDARRMVNRIAKTAGCRHITPHGLRRTFCTAGLVSGVPMRDMQIAMRHANPRISMAARFCAKPSKAWKRASIPAGVARRGSGNAVVVDLPRIQQQRSSGGRRHRAVRRQRQDRPPPPSVRRPAPGFQLSGRPPARAAIMDARMPGATVSRGSGASW